MNIWSYTTFKTSYATYLTFIDFKPLYKDLLREIQYVCKATPNLAIQNRFTHARFTHAYASRPF